MLIERPTYGRPGKNLTVFERAGKGTRLAELFGLDCASAQDGGPDIGLFSLSTPAGHQPLQVVRSRFEPGGLRLAWQTPDQSVRVTSAWKFSSGDGIWSRRDTLKNVGSKRVTVCRCLSRFAFAQGPYEVYSQNSTWGSEKRTLDHGGIVLACEGGNTTQGGTPYMCLRHKESESAVAFHVLPRGNWVIRVTAVTSNTYLPYVAVVELGLADDDMAFRLARGESLELPEILIQAVPSGRPHDVTADLHRYALAKVMPKAKAEAPVVYNPWFDDFENLDPQRLRRQLAAARRIGCEVFTVDAGWYGRGEGEWYEQVGDWREKLGGAFRGTLAEFADEVRAAGLGFGLWIEPERIGQMTPLGSRHPSWLLPSRPGMYYPDLTKAAAYRWVKSQIKNVIERYQPVWLKVDFNNRPIGPDRAGAALSGYYTAWYKLMEELRAACPKVFFEGCASGGMRLDMNALSHCDAHFLSDNVNPYDVLRISEGALLRLPPGRLSKWTVLRSVGKTIPRYGTPADATEVRLVTPAGAGEGGNHAETVDVDFAARVMMQGAFGLSGDLAGLPEFALERLRHHVRFFKQWRRFINSSVAYMLTPPRPMGDRRGWAAVQLVSPVKRSSLVFVYRLNDWTAQKRFRLCGLDRKRRYTVTADGESATPHRKHTGTELMDHGLMVQLPAQSTAAILVVRPVSR